MKTVVFLGFIGLLVSCCQEKTSATMIHYVIRTPAAEIASYEGDDIICYEISGNLKCKDKK